MAGLYIHIPFCRSKCHYCDFYSHPNRRESSEYVGALLREWDMRKGELLGEDVSTIYLGGGTPSMLPTEEIRRIADYLSHDINIPRLREFTIECNPEDISTENISEWRSAGINRVSMGVQSFDDDMLLRIGRKHQAADSVKALDLLSEAGINYNADLIYGLPGQSLCHWEGELQRMLQWRPPHLSCYLLSYEPGTRLHAMLSKGAVEEADEELANAMYARLCQLSADAGYGHYEISNFAQQGKMAIHNSLYWNYTPYLGLGAGAHSFTSGVRSYNPWNSKKYIQSLSAGCLPAEIETDESEDSKLNDYIITSLRTSAGFNQDLAKRLFSKESLRKFNQNLEILLANKILSNEIIIDDYTIRINEQNWLTADALMRELIIAE